MDLTRRDVLLAGGAAALTAGLTATATTSAGAITASPTPSPTPTTTPPPGVTPPLTFPLGLMQMPLRDPYIVPDAKTGLYHLYVANNTAISGVAGVGTMVYRSPDLQHWAKPVVVFQPPLGMWARNGGWAPEVHHWQGRYYLFVTFHNPHTPLAVPHANQYGIPVQSAQFARGTVIAVADSLVGPFTVLDPSKPVAPATFMTLDGTLFKDEKGKPWMVYAHEWVQKIDGTIEALPLKSDLSGAAGHPIHVFKGSDATWLANEMPSPSANQISTYVTDGPQLYRLPGGALAMLWATYEKNINNVNGTVSGHYVQTYAVSPSGKLKGPWVQHQPLLRHDSGHGMLFKTIPKVGKPARPMLVLHHGATHSHAKLYEIELRRDGLKLGKHRKDLDGSA
jgi:hypothetical protein